MTTLVCSWRNSVLQTCCTFCHLYLIRNVYTEVRVYTIFAYKGKTKSVAVFVASWFSHVDAGYERLCVPLGFLSPSLRPFKN